MKIQQACSTFMKHNVVDSLSDTSRFGRAESGKHNWNSDNTNTEAGVSRREGSRHVYVE